MGSPSPTSSGVLVSSPDILGLITLSDDLKKFYSSCFTLLSLKDDREFPRQGTYGFC